MKSLQWLMPLGIAWSLLVGNVLYQALPAARAESESASQASTIPPVPDGHSRTRIGLQALYDFTLSDVAIVKDVSGVGQPINLQIADTECVRRSDGSLEVLDETVIRSDTTASRIADAVRWSGELTIEAWIRPAKASMSGPARIVTFSKSGLERNFTLGQDDDEFDVRLRTTQTSTNGIPSLSTSDERVETELTHVAYTHDRNGRTRIYINGKTSSEMAVPGSLSNWDGEFQLALANELTMDRPWLGTFYLVAIYNRELLPQEVEQNFQAGSDVHGAPIRLAQEQTSGGRFFDSQVAPLLLRHCLECHDSSSKEGGLDLSQKAAALAGGDSGEAVLAGNADESLLWQYVEADIMPEDRSPLSEEEKAVLRKWIDEGAVWSGDAIDEPLLSLNERAVEIWPRRLTVPEYIETVRSAVGVDIEAEARKFLPPDLRADGFHNTAYNLNVDLGHVEAYATLAQLIVSQMDVEAFAAKFSKSQKLIDKDMRRLIGEMGKWILRGPLDEREIVTFRGISTTVASAGGDFEEAVGCVIEAMLQSPRFLYRMENQRGDGTEWPVDDYELASRISYIIWGGPPDKKLLKAADNGRLSEPGVLNAQVERMLKDPRAVERSAQFIQEWLDLERLANLRPNEDRFPNWNAQLASDMREETIAYFKEVAWQQNRPLVELLNAQFTYATPRLAEHYGLSSKGLSIGLESRPWASEPKRAGRDLLVLYTFQGEKSDKVSDMSGSSAPIHLTIENPSAVERSEYGLTVNSATLIAASEPSPRLVDAIKKSNAVTLEAWITPADSNQNGPARILTFSDGTSRRNFTLGQDGDRFDVRFRATRTDANGLPSVSSSRKTVETRPTHVVFTRDATGRAKLYINGNQNAAGNVDGSLSNWDDGFTLSLANETTRDRPWLGTLHQAAVYGRALTLEEIRAKGAVWSRYDLSEVPGRGGLLTQGSSLTVGGDEASMVARGLFVLQDFLRGSVKDPPPCVDTTPVPTKPGLTQRAIAEARVANNSCGGCHAKFEPLAFGLEKFDGVGAYHESDEHGNKLRDDGEILFPGSNKPVPYQTSAELMDLLADSKRVRECMTWKVAQFALGRPLTAADRASLKKIHQAAWDEGGTYASLITAIATSDLVRTTPTEKYP